MMESNPVRYFGLRFTNALRCTIIYLTVLMPCIAQLAEKISPVLSLPHIVSQYTKKTIEFIETSDISYFKNGLETVWVGGKKCLLRKQTRHHIIYLNICTLQTIPMKLVQGIEFRRLHFDADGQFDPAILEKILNAFGTINADSLGLFRLNNRNGTPQQSGQLAQQIERWFLKLGPLEDTPKHSEPELAKCVLNVKELTIYATPKTTIGWFQGRVDLSGSPIKLVIDCMSDFGNLEVLDGFNAKRITSLMIDYIDKLDSLDCKLLREGPLPDELVFDRNALTIPVISDQIIQNIVSNHWVFLSASISLWKVLMKPGEQPKRLTAESLKITLDTAWCIPPPMAEMNRAIVKDLTLVFDNYDILITTEHLEQTLEWVFTHFDGLEKLSIDIYYDASPLRDFARKNSIEIATIPTLKSISVCDIECSVYQSKKETVLCLSPAVWDLHTKGKLADELTSSQIDLSQLSTEHQALLMSKEGVRDAKNQCTLCSRRFDGRKNTNPNTEIHILARPEHRLCTTCQVDLTSGDNRNRRPRCPTCLKYCIVSLVKHRLHKNAKGIFDLTMGTPLPVLSFPRPTPDSKLTPDLE
ncbi:hypothetical protein NEDG_02256 [Nematocida displodere]|uniref:Uncharacterized protein n=1 Tax=Nematocida displodere TaxID=1805483 RepID=A0A177EHB6_9MICR|nr:hypothetical protein NEDG_02256 [Nematocida displodere]